MFNRKSIYLFLGSATVCSLFIQNLFFFVLPISLLIIIFMSRGIFYTLRANKEFVNKNEDRGYELLTKAYKSGGIPIIVINGYIYISLKKGYTDIALEAIEKVLNGKIGFKVKDSQKNMILTQKGLYLWQIGDLEGGTALLNELHENEYRTSTFYGNFGCLLYLSKDYEKAEKLCLEAYDYDNKDKVTLDNLVAIYLKLDKLELAEKYYDELIELKPTFAEAFYNGALLNLNKNSIDEAKELLSKCREFKLYNISAITDQDIQDLENKIEAKS